MEDDKIVVIKVTWKTRERLKSIGKKGDTYEDVISRMLDEHEAVKREKRQ